VGWFLFGSVSITDKTLVDYVTSLARELHNIPMIGCVVSVLTGNVFDRVGGRARVGDDNSRVVVGKFE
jgi:hypothetical protein